MTANWNDNNWNQSKTQLMLPVAPQDGTKFTYKSWRGGTVLAAEINTHTQFDILSVRI